MLQLRLPIQSPPALEAALALAAEGSQDERGAIFTRPEIAEFILDLSGYTLDKALHKQRLLEPSFGDGDFLIPAVRRLLTAWVNHGGKVENAVKELSTAIRAVEIHTATYSHSLPLIREELIQAGIPTETANTILDHWLRRNDFLLEPLEGDFDYVVGNPPYVRQERIPEALLSEYRARYATMYDRADLYIPFIERGLTLLSLKGKLCFICPERWIKNTYGGPLRRLVSQRYHLEVFVDMNGVDAFQREVSAYPSIMLFQRGHGTTTLTARSPTVERSILEPLARALTGSRSGKSPISILRLENVVSGNAPWLLQHNQLRPLVEAIEAKFPLLEDSGCKVGIGVASGADKVFIRSTDDLDIEESRKLPLATTRDLKQGQLSWTGRVLANPYESDGQLVDLDCYPKLKAYYEGHRSVIAKRHCVRNSPSRWYRTIDRVISGLAERPKLLIPDIQGTATIVLDEGFLYPHHNLYYVISEDWDLNALRAVLLSSITRAFILAYATQMRGGFLRFQAQYIRRLRLPLWEEVSDQLRQKLIEAGKIGKLDACDAAMQDLYKLSHAELSDIRSQVE